MHYSCLKAIRIDNFARKIFHKQHIQSSERLSNGFATYMAATDTYTAEKYAEDVESFHASQAPPAVQVSSSGAASSAGVNSTSSAVHDEELYD